MADLDTDVLIIGAGASGLGLAIQLQRKLGHTRHMLLEKTHSVGGTWAANTYPGCGCDVASHFYSYSFAPNADWGRKYSLQPEIQAYFERVAKSYGVLNRVRFGVEVRGAVWDEGMQGWRVSVRTEDGGEESITARALVSGVGALSVPRACEVPGHERFRGRLFHSAAWDEGFHWAGKDVVVVGNGCSATQFVPIITARGPQGGEGGAAKKVTQFARQAHYLEERQNPYFGPGFKAVMRYVPLAMRLYRLKIYTDMERDFAGFHTVKGKPIRDKLVKSNEAYVKKVAPGKYWDHLIPKHEIGCKRKVLDTDYLACLWRENMELVADDPLDHIEEDGVVTKSGRFVKADAIVLANGFQTTKMLFPMKIKGENGIDLEEHWNNTTSGAPAAYMGTLTSGYPNFFIMMGPNTVTGHLSVIYTIECQILLAVALLKPILKPSLPTLLWSGRPSSVSVTSDAAVRDIKFLHDELKSYVWSSGCTSWALDPATGTNIAMYPRFQWHFWLRCLFLDKDDFHYRIPVASGGKPGSYKRAKIIVGFGWRYLRRSVLVMALLTALLVAWKRQVSPLAMVEATKTTALRALRRIQKVVQ